jgi:hypothetical protein
MTNKSREAILARLRRKIDIIRLDQKQIGANMGGHASECLSLLDMLDRMEEGAVEVLEHQLRISETVRDVIGEGRDRTFARMQERIVELEDIVSKQNLEKAIAVLEKQHDEMWAQTRGVRRSTANADLAMLGARIDRHKAELAKLANPLMVANTESPQTLMAGEENEK